MGSLRDCQASNANHAIITTATQTPNMGELDSMLNSAPNTTV